MPTVTYSNKNNDNPNINDSSKSINKDRHSSKNNPLTDERKSVTILGDSLLNGINEQRLSHKHRVKVFNKPGATSERILEEIDDVIPEHLVIHVGTNDLTNGINLLNNAKKIVKKINEKLPKTCITLSSIINRKDRKGIDKKTYGDQSKIKKLL